MAKISVVIVNWNSGALLAQCVASILRTTNEATLGQVVVIDNASSDTSLTTLREQFVSDARLHIIANSANRGFAAANNQGIKYLQQQALYRDNHVLLLNDDTLVPLGALAVLQQVLEETPQAGVVGPKLLNTDGSLQPSVRSFPTLPVMLALILKLPRLMPAFAWWKTYLQTNFNYTQQQNVDQVMGAAFLIHRDLLTPNHPNYVGWLDESFFVWFEEVDYCRRAQQVGWKVIYTPKTSITHIGGVSFAQLIGFKRSLPWIASAIHYTRKHLGLVSALILIIMTPVALLLTIPASFFNWVARQQSKPAL